MTTSPVFEVVKEPKQNRQGGQLGEQVEEKVPRIVRWMDLKIYVISVCSH
jgi:hypothetical protein